MLNGITYGTFLLFGACCILMVIFTVFFVPETSQVNLEKIHLLFEDRIISGATRDTFPKLRRANGLRHSFAEVVEEEAEAREGGKDGASRFGTRVAEGGSLGGGASR